MITKLLYCEVCECVFALLHATYWGWVYESLHKDSRARVVCVSVCVLGGLLPAVGQERENTLDWIRSRAAVCPRFITLNINGECLEKNKAHALSAD